MSRDDDVPLTVDFRFPDVAAAWVPDAEAKRPWRARARRVIASLVRDARSILELGPGPGFLAEAILETSVVERYVLFDFSEPFLDMCRSRLARFAQAEYVLGDFRDAAWPALVAGPFDAVVAMQSVHELRHRRHVPRLYAQLRPLVRDTIVICDHPPPAETDARGFALFASEAEHRAALSSAGFIGVELQTVETLCIYSATTAT